MHKLVNRKIKPNILNRLKSFPAVAILGPRQCGKSTLAKTILAEIPDSIYLDLERPSDINKLSDPEAFFKLNSKKLICLDEIQRVPELFPVMRSIIDENNRNGKFLILGSASPKLIRQSSESLAGRISYFELAPFLITEIGDKTDDVTLRRLWLRGGFPRSYLAGNIEMSMQWRIDFIRTFLESDIPSLGIKISSSNIRRLWTMLAHMTGQVLNSSRLGESMGVSYKTVQAYINLLEQTFVVRLLPPYFSNIKKRIIKSPKVYIRDSGILHALLGINTMNELLGHPVYGSSWEGFVIENILSSIPDIKASFFRTARGEEIDLMLETNRHLIAIECKSSVSPKASKSFIDAIELTQADEAYIVAPVEDSYPAGNKITICSLTKIIEELKRA